MLLKQHRARTKLKFHSKFSRARNQWEQLPKHRPASASCETYLSWYRGLCTIFPYKRCLWWNGGLMTELSFFFLHIKLKDALQELHLCHGFTVSCFPQIYIAQRIVAAVILSAWQPPTKAMKVLWAPKSGLEVCRKSTIVEITITM